MNLNDILSDETPKESHGSNDMESILDEEIFDNGNTVSGTDNVLQLHDGLYYLPTELTGLQKELSEMSLNIFKPELLEDMYTRKEKTSITCLLETSDEDRRAIKGNELTMHERIELLFDQLFLISKHPSLLVDHFMPKKLLLLQTNEGLEGLSGKFQLFNRLVNSFIDRYPPEESSYIYTTDMHILVVGQNVKELELIEALIIGKKVYYKNLSSHKLYEDDRELERGSDKQVEERRKSRRGKRFNKPTGEKRSKVCLYLVTSLQLYNNYIPSSAHINSKFNFIFSFDMRLDISSPSIEIMRSLETSSGGISYDSRDTAVFKTPVLIPIPLYSIEHMLLLIPELQSGLNLISQSKDSPKYRRKLQALHTLVVNRGLAYRFDDSDFFIHNYGFDMSLLFDWLHNWTKVNFPLENLSKKCTNNEEIVFSFDGHDIESQLRMNYLPDVDQEMMLHCMPKKEEGDIMLHSSYKLDPFTYKTYKEMLTFLVHHRISQYENASDSCEKNFIIPWREKESRRQEEIDRDEIEVAQHYNKLKKLNTEASNSERKLGRVESDLKKFQEMKADWESKLDFLKQNTLTSGNGDELEKAVEAQRTIIDNLREEVEKTDKEYEKIDKVYESSRSKYQITSVEAARMSTEQKTLRAQNDKLRNHFNGMGFNILPSLIGKEDIISLESRLARLKSENQFIQTFYNKKLEKLVKERRNVLEGTNSGSNSRSNSRLSRASTPY